MSFADRQWNYTQQLNRSFPSSAPASDSATIQRALGVVDTAIPASMASSVTTGPVRDFMASVGGQAAATTADAACRLYPFPGSGIRPADARTGCGWWYVTDPTRPSTGAYGTRRGPMSPSLDTQAGAGQWVWDIKDAARLEAMKRASSIKSCADLQYATGPPAMGWCPPTGRAIPVDSAGNPLYPRMSGGDCPGTAVVTSASQCPPPPSGSAPGISSVCSDGALNSTCLLALSSQVCGPQGSLAQLYATGSWPSTSSSFNNVNAIAARGFELNGALLNGGQTTVQTALKNLGALRQFAYTNADPSMARAAAAAANMCGGQAFDPCALSPTDTGPFDPDCITTALVAAGYKPSSTLMPANGGLSYWNSLGTWGAVLARIASQKASADVPGPQQGPAILAVYGTRVKFPGAGCNTNGVSFLRYYAPSSDLTLFPVAGPQTHFLGRYLFKQGFPATMWNIPEENASSAAEAYRMTTSFVAASSGTYQFVIQTAGTVRMLLDGQPYLTVQGGGGPSAGLIVSFGAGEAHTFVIDYINTGSEWSFILQMSVNGSAWTPVPSNQLFLLQDRRLPLVELAFNRMSPTTLTSSQVVNGVPISDTNGVFQNLLLTANIGTLDGRTCMIVSGQGSGIFNYATFNQGVRLRAFKSITCMIHVDTATPASGVNPMFMSFYNVPQSTVTGYPRKGWDQSHIQPIANRTNDFDLNTNGAGAFPWGIGALEDGLSAGTVFSNNLNRGAYFPLTLRKWTHLAWVWDDDFSGYTMYTNGEQTGRAFMSPYAANLVMEQIRIGSDNWTEGQSWTGGIAWWRGFDYRLGSDLIVRDLADGWAGLASTQISPYSGPFLMGGPGIGQNLDIQGTAVLNNGHTVYIAYDGSEWMRMLTDDGVSKYVQGDPTQFSISLWDSYTTNYPGAYVLVPNSKI